MADWLSNIQQTKKVKPTTKASGAGGFQGDWLSGVKSGKPTYQPNQLVSEIKSLAPPPEEKKSIWTKAKESGIFGQIKAGAKRTAINTKNFFRDQFRKESERAGEALDLYKKTQDVSSLFGAGNKQYVQNQQSTLDRQISELKAIPKPSKTQKFRINNLQDKRKQIEDLARLTPEELSKKNLTGMKLEKRGAGIGRGTLGNVESLAGWVKSRTAKADPETFAGQVYRVADNSQDKLNKWVEFTRPENPDLADTLMEGLGSTLPFYMVGGVTQKLSKGISKVSPMMARVFGMTSSAFLESAVESGSVYEDNIEAGKSKDDSIKAADTTFGANLVINFLTSKFGFGDDVRGIKGAMIRSSEEGLQEVSQQVVSNVNTDKPWDEGLVETGLIGSILGGTLGEVGRISPTTEAKIEEVIKEEVPVVDELIKERQDLDPTFDNELDKKQYDEFIKSKLEAARESKQEGEITVIQSGDGKIVDTVPATAIKRGVSADTKVFNVSQEQLNTTGDVKKDKNGERLISEDVIKEKIEGIEKAVEEVATEERRSKEEELTGVEKESREGVEEKTLSEYYLKQDQKKTSQAIYEVMTELEVSEARQRIYKEGDVIGEIKSTFPSWVPPELRSKKLFDSVIKDISDPANIKFPPNSQPRKQELYEVLLSEIDSRAETDSGNIIERIKNGKKEIKTSQDKKTDDSSSKRSERPKKKSVEKKQTPKTDKRKGGIFDRTFDELKTETNVEDNFESITLRDQADRASKYVKKNPTESVQIALRQKPAPKGITYEAINIAAAQQAKSIGDMQLYTDLVAARSIIQAKNAQALGIERLVNSLSTDSFVKQVLRSRMQTLSTQKGFKEKFTRGMKKGGKIKLGLDILSETATKASEKINRKVKSKIASAQSIIDSLTC
ncbi:MAG: hypothetical protein ACTSQE_07395 [Candidatus Heimdallarchaeaceae archaeon]